MLRMWVYLEDEIQTSFFHRKSRAPVPAELKFIHPLGELGVGRIHYGLRIFECHFVLKTGACIRVGVDETLGANCVGILNILFRF